MTNDKQDITPEHLSDYIDAYQAGDAPEASGELDALAGEILSMVASSAMDESYAVRLGERFTPLHDDMIVFPIAVSRMVAMFVLTVAGIGLMLVTPQGQALAAEVMTLLFPRETSESRTITYVEYEETDITEYTTVAQFNDRVNFDLRVPTGLPSYMTLNKIEHLESRNVVALWYSGNGFSARILQQPLADVDAGLLWHTFEPYSIGPEAALSDVRLADGSTAQYVQGMWTGNEDEGYTWNPRFSFYHMRWEDETTIYEIRFSGGMPFADPPTMLARIAESMQSTDE